MPKHLGIRLQPKDEAPERDEGHLRKIRLQTCLRCAQLELRQIYATEAHHCRAIGPKTAGVQVSDYLAVPLCVFHHKVEYGIGALHYGSERKNWVAWGIDPVAWISEFSEKGRAKIEWLRKQRLI